MYSAHIDHLQTTDNSRHYCRNRHCRAKLKAPTDNLHRAFCCRGCYRQFYRVRCIVCEKDLPPGRSDRRFCRKPSCRSQYRRNPTLYDHSAGLADLSLKSPIKPGLKSGLGTDRTWRIIAGPALGPSAFHCATIEPDTELVSQLTRLHKQHYRDAAAGRLIGPTDLPLNRLPKSERRGGLQWQRHCPIPADLNIPDFLRQVPGTKS